MTRIIDLSLPIDETVPEPFSVVIHRLGHKEGAARLGRKFINRPGNPWHFRLKNRWLYLTGRRKIDGRSFPDGMFMSHESVTASVHCGTHVDAPFHFGPASEGAPAKKVEDLPLEWCYGDGVVLDVSMIPPGGEIRPDDIDGAQAATGYTIKPGDIVLLRTGADRHFGRKEYFFKFPGLGEAATRHLLDMGVKTIGIDAVSLDRPFGLMVEEYYRTRDSGRLWPAHLYGRKREYCHIERLANLDRLPKPSGFKFACFPVKIKDAGAAWARAVAIIED